MESKILFYQDSEQFKVETLTFASLDELRKYVLDVFFTQKAHRWYYENGQSLWCDVTIDSKKHGRYQFNLVSLELEFFICWKHSNMIGGGWFAKVSRVISETATHYTVVYNEETGQKSDVCKTLVL